MDCKGGSIGIGWDVARRGGFHRPGTAAAASLQIGTTAPSFAAAAQTDARVGTSMTKNLGFTIPGTSQGATGEVGFPPTPLPLLHASSSRLVSHVCAYAVVHIRVSLSPSLPLSLSLTHSQSLTLTRCLCPPRPLCFFSLLLQHTHLDGSTAFFGRAKISRAHVAPSRSLVKARYCSSLALPIYLNCCQLL
jgi:hypothetical protein